MRYAIIFPGQATKIVDPRPLLEDYPGALSVLNFGKRFFGDLYQKSPEELMLTLNQQPGVALHSLAVANALNIKGFEMPEFVAGHSLGAVVSLIYTRVLPDEIGLKTLAARAQITQKWADQKPGKMAAIIGLCYDDVQFACEETSKQGKIVRPANYNEPRQIVISGEAEAVEEVCAYLTAKYKPKKIVFLPTTVAFHSPLIKEASEEFDLFLYLQNFSDPVRGIRVVIDDYVFRTGLEIKQHMMGHMFRPVFWAHAIMNILEQDIRNFLIVGPGQKMVRMIQRTAEFTRFSDVKITCLSTGEEIKAFLESPFA